MPRVLISVYDKAGLPEFVNTLVNLGWDIVASGGTAAYLRQQGFMVTPVEQVTGAIEMLQGRVKTLHPAIYAGILARDTMDDMEELRQNNYAPIAMVVCNLYPFVRTIAQSGVTLEQAIEQIDIGGVSMIRAAAKNFTRVAVVCEPSDYKRVEASLRAGGDVPEKLARELAQKAFALTRDYDTAIHAYLAQDEQVEAIINPEMPEHISMTLHRVGELRYGENPHQSAAFYGRSVSQSPLGGELLGGAKQLSYNNLLDIDAAWRIVSNYDEPCVAVVKHLSPTGIAIDGTTALALRKAIDSDPVSAFGGIIACNRTVDERFIEEIGSLLVDVVVAPDFSADAVEMLLDKRRNCRVLKLPERYDMAQYEMRSVHQGFLLQEIDAGDPEGTLFKTVTERQPTVEERRALAFAWKAVQFVRSNSIVIASETATLGIGGGLPSRVDAVELAIAKADDRVAGTVLASDAFFPFPDSIERAAEAGITAVVQPGGSIRDARLIEAANAHDMAMVFTRVRHFRH